MVYLLHFDRPFRHMRHYVGAAADLLALELLIANPGMHTRSSMLIAAKKAGVRFTIGRIWRGGAERADLVRSHQNHTRHCDICTCARSGVALP